MIDVAPAEAGGAITLEAEKAALVGKTGAVTRGEYGEEDAELLEPHAASSNDANRIAPVE